jgi:hypothetical protein
VRFLDALEARQRLKQRKFKHGIHDGDQGHGECRQPEVGRCQRSGQDQNGNKVDRAETDQPAPRMVFVDSIIVTPDLCATCQPAGCGANFRTRREGTSRA